jgi:LmbE family N-acetylglucosaminyl deacetylase
MSLRARLRRLKRAISRVIGRCWEPGFATLGPFIRSDAAQWSSSGTRRVVVLAPHADDEAIGCAGSILKHVGCGDRVSIVIATDGRQSRAIADPTKMAEQRHAEAVAAGRLLGVVSVEWLGFHEGGWELRELQSRLETLLDDIEPDVIYAPSRIDFHPEHYRVAYALARALDSHVGVRARTIDVRIYSVQVPLTPALANLVVDVSDVAERCHAVLRSYSSQAGSIECCYRKRRYGARLHRLRGEVEEFWELPAARYASLHLETPEQWPGAFRGLRFYAWSDPFAYLVGQRERRRLRSAAAAS